MLPKNKLAIASALIVCAALASACKSSSPHSADAPGGTTGAGGAGPVSATNCPASATKAIGDGAEIKVGIVLPQSGPFAALSTVATGVSAYFDSVNADGGVAGHKLKLLVKDDGYDPSKTVVADNELISQDQIFATVAQVGTPTVAATQKLHEQTCTPQLWVQAGDPTISADFGAHPWTTNGILAYNTESAMWGQYIKAHKPGATVAMLALNNDFGGEYTTGVNKAAKTDGFSVATVQKVDPTATSVSSQITTILSKRPDVVIGAVGGAFCSKFMQGLAQGGYQGITIVTTACSSVNSFFKPVDPAGDKVFSLSTAPTLGASAEQGVTRYESDLRKYGNGVSPADNNVQAGYNCATLFVAALNAAAASPGGLTRVSLMNAAWTLNYAAPLAIGPAKLSGANDAYALETAQMTQYDAASHTQKPTGEKFDEEGKSGAN
ncbi:ABC transporter substrate-binding protein [Dactylosporangium sp. CA-092794]|uniref:ABC transporter substrate-binding protein n=1 Tax=Dactylosporangium sp. CA-092794 TaxID=3239929 RepID=UPI003D8E3081